MPGRTVADAVASEAEDNVVTSIDRYDDVDVFIGLDVGKGEHHAVALDRVGKRLFDRPLPNDERRLRAVLDQLASHGVVLLVVDQPATIGALPVAVAQAAGALVGYLPGLAMKRTMFLSAFAALRDPESRVYYDRKIAQGKRHN